MLNSSYVIALFMFLLTVSFAEMIHAEDKEGAITSGEITAHIKYLASDELEGRMTGSEGNAKAARYIAEQFKKVGLVPLGDSGTYFQYFSFPSGVLPGESNSLVLSLNGKKTKLEIDRDFFPLGLSSSGEAAGEIVFAGYGISAPELDYDDYEGIDVGGKIVLVLRYTPEGLEYDSPFYGYAPLRYKVFNAREKGAAAVIFTTLLTRDEEDGMEPFALDSSSSDSGIPAVIMTTEIARDILASEGKDLDSLEQALSEGKPRSFPIPGARAGIRTDMIRENGGSANVLGFLEGSDPVLKNEVIVVGAHYDHIGKGERDSRAGHDVEREKIHNGADDNASGVAGLLELSEFFSERKDTLKRSLLFIAFSGEELGLLGSSYYIEHPKISPDRTVAMINMDMIGRLDGDNLIVFGTGSSPEWERLIEDANSAPKLNISFQNSAFGPSDQSVFYADEVPAIQFFTGLHSDYHTPLDDWQKINSAGEKKVLALISRLIEELGDSGDKIAFSKSDEKPKTASRFKVYLGTIPDYASSEEGVKLTGVREGSPAFEAGLRGKDTIVELDGKEVKNIYDYSYALGALKAGVGASVVIMRDGRRVALEIVPEER